MSWQVNLLEHWMLPSEVEAICLILLYPLPTQDSLVWSYTKQGVYTVWSGNWLASHLEYLRLHQSKSLPSVRKHPFWNSLWKLDIPPKFRHFLWRVATGILATGEAIAKRVRCDVACKLCGTSVDSIRHAVFQCKLANEVWKSTSWDVYLANTTSSSFQDLLQ